MTKKKNRKNKKRSFQVKSIEAVEAVQNDIKSQNNVQSEVENEVNKIEIKKDGFVSLDDLRKENNLRVKKHREKLKSKGFKQISFFISSSSYSHLQYLKSLKNKSYADIIESLIAKEYYRLIRR